MLTPKALRPGDTIGVGAFSSGFASVVPHRVERGIAFLESLGFRIKAAPHLYGRRGWTSGTPGERAADLHELFADPEVKAIIANIGGDHSCQLLPLLDWELIADNPKIFMGFSDMTVLNLAMYVRTGLGTFNGPAVMIDWAEFPEPLPYTVSHALRMLTVPEPAGDIAPAEAWTEEFLDWTTQADLTRPRLLEPSPGWTWLKPGRAEGALLGGCLESLQHLRGTPFWPDFTGALFFWETSEEVPPPSKVDGILADYENMGVLERISGMLVGRPLGYTPEQRAQLREVILERTKRYSFPIIADMDFGHTAPQFTLPIGRRALIDATARRFAITESAIQA